MLSLEDALALDTIQNLNDAEVLTVLGLLINRASDTGDLAANEKAFHWIGVFEKRHLSDKAKVIFDYFHANAWGNRQQSNRANRKAVWAWDQEAVQQQIFLLRRAARNPAFELHQISLRCEVLTNLASQLNAVGRMVEARQVWSHALRLEPQFWMARANRGRALMYYCNRLYDHYQQAAFALQAYEELTQAVVDLDTRPEFGVTDLRSRFVEDAALIIRYWDLKAIASNVKLGNGKLGRSKAEIAYRKWCLREELFLNPLNDITSESGAADDSLSLPNMIIKIGEAPVFTGFYNQLKQEFVSARWSYHSGLISYRAHYSDFRVALHDTLDSPIYGLAVEQIKIAFRTSYSLFDKIAYFLNRYLCLGIKERDVSFRSIWKAKISGPVRPEFDSSENWPFRGLYWLAKDFFEEGYRDYTEPDAQRLTEWRNHFEHRYFKVHRDNAPTVPTAAGNLQDSLFDDFAYSVSLADLETRTLRVLKLSRAALIYLALGVSHEENRRRAHLGSDEIMSTMGPFPIYDKFKTKF